MVCPQVVEQLCDYVDGRVLSLAQIQKISEHLAACGECRMWWDLVSPLSEFPLRQVA
jgi:predicted anti-sigma-YlaC factor YlaD